MIQEIEKSISDWIDNNKVWWYLITKFTMIWIILSICIVTMCGIVGMSVIDDNQNMKYYNGTITDQEYNTWHDVVIPISNIAFKTMEILLYIMVFLYVYYVLFKLFKVQNLIKK